MHSEDSDLTDLNCQWMHMSEGIFSDIEARVSFVLIVKKEFSFDTYVYCLLQGLSLNCVTVFTLCIWTPHFSTILVLIFEQVQFTT